MTPALTGNRIKRTRERFSLTKQAWAGLLGVSVSSVYRWESLAEPRLELFQRSLIDVLETLPKQDLSSEIIREAPLKVLWKLLGQKYGKKS